MARDGLGPTQVCLKGTWHSGPNTYISDLRIRNVNCGLMLISQGLFSGCLLDMPQEVRWVNPGLVTHTCHTSTQDVKAGGLDVLRPSGYMSSRPA